MQKIFLLSTDSLFAALFFGNLASVIFLLIYRHKSKIRIEQQLTRYLLIARFCFTFYYLVAVGRDLLPDWLSVSLGNSLNLFGFYMEAQAILLIIKEKTTATDILLRVLLIISLLLFNGFEYFMPTGNIRVILASVGVVSIMVLPCARMLISRDSSRFTKSVAILYCFFLIMLLPRVWFGLHDPEVVILMDSPVQTLTFLSLLLQLIIGLPAYILIIKEHSDDALVLMATTDRLTGATNRHAFFDAAAAVYDNCRYFHQAVSVLFIDIDHFKQINDRYGHPFGDCVLIKLAGIIDHCLRDSDLSCRYGGEEFLILLTHVSEDAAELVAERIMAEVEKAKFEEEPDFRFTVSIGVFNSATMCKYTFDEVIKAADEALYSAKRSGRNRIVYTHI